MGSPADEVPDLCLMRRSHTQSLASPIWRVIVSSCSAKKETTFYVHESVLKASIFEDHISKNPEVTSEHAVKTFRAVEVVTMALEYAYKGDYSPSIADIRGMDSATRDIEADHQLDLFCWVAQIGDVATAPLGDLAFQKFDACQISPGSFIDVVCDSDVFDIRIPQFAEWCDKWIKEHGTGLFASKKFEEAIGDGGFPAKTLMKLVAAHYPCAGTEGSKKRGMDGEDTEWSAKAPKTGEHAVLHVSR